MRLLEVHLKEVYPFLANGDCDPVLTVYLQETSPFVFHQSVMRPAMLILPGGGYYGISEHEGEPIALEFLNQGYQTAVLRYSVASTCRYSRWPQQLLEVAAAMDYLKSNAKDFRLDAEKISVMGFSAGGHLAASYATFWHRDVVSEKITPTKPAACVLVYPVITGGEKTHLGSLQYLFGHDEPTAEDRNLFSLENFVSEQTPPTFLFHTAEDDCVPVENSLLFAAALSANKLPFEMHIYPLGPHGMATGSSQVGMNVDYAAKRWIKDCFEWLRRTL